MLGLRVVRFGNDEVVRDAERSAVVGEDSRVYPSIVEAYNENKP